MTNSILMFSNPKQKKRKRKYRKKTKNPKWGYRKNEKKKTTVVVYVLVDITYSMQSAFNGVRQAFMHLLRYLKFFKNIKIKFVLYGDYTSSLNYEDIFYVIQGNLKYIIDELESFDFHQKKMLGGDWTEAMVTAFHYVAEDQKSFSLNMKSAVIVVSDADGQCVGLSNHSNRVRERKALMMKGISPEQANMEYFLNHFKENGVITCWITYESYQIARYFAFNAIRPRRDSYGQEHVFKMLIGTVSALLGLSRFKGQDEKCCPSLKLKKSFFTELDVQTFRQELRPEHLALIGPLLAKLYFKAIDLSNAQEAIKHSEFIRRLNTLVPGGYKFFKECSIEELKLSNLQSLDEKGNRIYMPPYNAILFVEAIKILTYTKPKNWPLKFLQLLKNIEFIDSKNLQFGNGIPLSAVLKQPTLLLSYIFREDNEYCPNISNSFFPVIALGILVHCQEIEGSEPLISSIIEKLKTTILIPTDKPKIFSTLFNGALLSDYKQLSKHISKEQKKALQKMWPLVKTADVLKRDSQEVQFELDPTNMPSWALTKYLCFVNICYDFTIGIWMPSCIFKKATLQDVDIICEKLTKFETNFKHIPNMNTHTRNLKAHARKFEGLYVSTYALNFYMKYECIETDRNKKRVVETNELDDYMSSDMTGCKTTPSLSEYAEVVGANGEHVFEHLADTATAPKGGIKAVFCIQCKSFFSVIDSLSDVQNRCVQCRTAKKTRQSDDRSPSQEIKNHYVECKYGHSHISSFPIKPENLECGFCRIQKGTILQTEKVSFAEIVRENRKLFSYLVDIPVEIIDILLGPAQLSAYSTVHSGENKNVNSLIFQNWKTVSSTDSKESFTYKGCPLVADSDQQLRNTIQNGFKVICVICWDHKFLRQMTSICKNAKCRAEACVKCLKDIYGNLSNDYVGKVKISCASCFACRGPVKGNKYFHSWHLTFLNKKLNKHLLNCFFHKCEKKCPPDCNIKNKNVYICECRQFFSKEKEVCRAADEEEVEKPLCPECVEKKRAAAEICKMDSKLLSKQDKIGYVYVDGFQMRACPHCHFPTERNDGCCHMKCTNCETHYCWCCGQKFDNAAEVYEHLRTIYLDLIQRDNPHLDDEDIITHSPSDELIREAHEVGRVIDMV